MYILGLLVAGISGLVLMVFLFGGSEINKLVKFLVCIAAFSGVCAGFYLMHKPSNEEVAKEKKIRADYFTKMGEFYKNKCNALVVHDGEVTDEMKTVLKCDGTIIMVDARLYNKTMSEYNKHH